MNKGKNSLSVSHLLLFVAMFAHKGYVGKHLSLPLASLRIHIPNRYEVHCIHIHRKDLVVVKEKHGMKMHAPELPSRQIEHISSLRFSASYTRYEVVRRGQEYFILRTEPRGVPS